MTQSNGNGALAKVESPTLDPTIVQSVLLGGDLSRLSAEQRVNFYNRVCDSLGLNPLTQPFAYLKLNGKEVLYAKKDATEQLRFIHNISIDPKAFTREVIEGVYVVTAPASMPSGRTDVSTGAVPIDGLKGENRANAMMKAETKAKRRVTLSICGLGMLDETEVESIDGATTVNITVAPAPRITAPAAAPDGYDEWLFDLYAVAQEGETALKKTWSASAIEFRRHLTGTNAKEWEAIKAKAASVQTGEGVSA